MLFRSCALELCSLHYDYGVDPERIVANGLFADGAAAMVLSPGDGTWRLAANGSCLLPDRSDERRVGKEGRSRWSPEH